MTKSYNNNSEKISKTNDDKNNKSSKKKGLKGFLSSNKKPKRQLNKDDFNTVILKETNSYLRFNTFSPLSFKKDIKNKEVKTYIKAALKIVNKGLLIKDISDHTITRVPYEEIINYKLYIFKNRRERILLIQTNQIILELCYHESHVITQDGMFIFEDTDLELLNEINNTLNEKVSLDPDWQ